MGEIITIRTIFVAAFVLFLVSLFTSFVSAQTCVPPPEGIVAWWPLDEWNGTLMQDIVGTNPGVLINGVQPGHVGKVGNAPLFDGVNDYIAVPDSDLWAFGSDNFTIELWMNLTVPQSGDIGHPGEIFIGNDEGPWYVKKWFFSLNVDYLYMVFYTPIFGERFLPLGLFHPTLNRWYHVAARRSGDNLTVFANGVPLASAAFSFVVANASAPLTIGQAESLGFMNGMIDEISVYHRALSDQEIAAIADAGSAGKCKVFSITTPSPLGGIVGQPLTYTMQTRFGTAPFTWSIASGRLPNGLTLSSDGILSGTSTEGGSFSFVVNAVDANNLTAERTLQLDVLLTLPPLDIRIEKIGTFPVPGRDVDYFIMVENRGTFPAQNVEIVEPIMPQSFTLREVDPHGIANITTLSNVSTIIWQFDLLPSEVKLLSYKVNVLPRTPVGSVVYGGPACVNPDQPRLSACLRDALIASGTCTVCIGVCSIAVGICAVPPTSPFVCPSAILSCVGCWISCNSQIGRVFDCYQAHSQDCAVHEQDVRRGVDPNEKVVLANKFIQPNQTLPYVIHFENVGNADAQNIFVNDTLAPALDQGTLRVVNASGSLLLLQSLQTIVLLETNRSRLVNITIGNQTIIINRTHIEQWNVTLRSNTLYWTLSNIYMKPNVTDQVLYSIKPTTELPSGTQIRNKATIQFEIFESLETNETLNIVDTDRPVCTVNPLPSEIRNTTFFVSWNGSDPVGEIEGYTIFVSENNGAYRSFINSTLTTNATLTGVQGRTYGFVCIAKDTAGNIEVQQTSGPEAFTRIPGADLQVIGVPRIGTTINFSVFDWAHPGNKYVLALSMGTSPGIPLGDGRVIPLNPDIIFLLSIQGPSLIGLQNSINFLNEQGQGTSYWDIPNVPELNGITVYAAFVVLDHTLPVPFASISNAVPMTLQA